MMMMGSKSTLYYTDGETRDMCRRNMRGLHLAGVELKGEESEQNK